MPAPSKLLTRAAVTARTSLSRSTIYRKIDRNEFPRQLPISTGRVAWLESDIDAWVAAHIPHPS